MCTFLLFRAFAIVETIESKYAIDHLPHHELYELSPQQLISCEVVTYLDGCDGGVLVIAFDTLVKVRGVMAVSWPLHSIL